MGCVSCGRGFHRECKKGCSNCHPADNLEKEEVSEPGTQNEQVSTRKSRKENLKDPVSTGRKRAARLYPLDRSNACEWRGQRNCGGGRRPIIGCLDGFQQHRHHGPVKDTTRNELGNVHRICDDCHVHWHELNDLIYDVSDYNLLPHQPEPASPEDIVNNILAWKSGEIGKQFELASTRNLEKYNASQAALPSSDSD